MNTESKLQAIDHIRFQLDLLKITGMPIELTGPSVMQEQESQHEAVRAMQELQTRIDKISLA